MSLRRAVLLLAATAVARGIVLTGDEVWVVNQANESGPFNLALRDVLRDAYMALGRTPVVLSAPPAANSLPVNTTLVFLGSPEAAPWLVADFPATAPCFAGAEAHCVLAARAPSGYSALVATGASMRGAIFGAYALSEEVLGANPLRWYTDDPLSYQAPLAVSDTLSVIFPPPRFVNRFFFINDEDLLANQFPGNTLGTAAIDSRAYIQMFETLLRLKMSGVIPATNPFADGELYALASARGLIVSHHHYSVTGQNVFAWPMSNTDWSWSKDPGSMMSLWRTSILAQASYEVVWSVGLRGLNDEPYTCPTPEICGREISEAMGNQTALIREIQPNATLVLFLWQELLDLLARDLLVVPSGVKILFTDAGNGYIRVDANWTQYADGVYYHTAMYNGQSNQLSEMIPVDRMISQFGPVFNGSRSLTVATDNLSDLRPCPMTSEFFARLVWNPDPFLSGDPAATALDYYAAWGARQHHIPGGAAAPAARAFASIWATFFNLPYSYAGLSDGFLSAALQAAAGGAASSIRTHGTVPADVLAAARGSVLKLSNGTDPTGAAPRATLATLLANATALVGALPPARAGYFISHTLTQVAMHAAGVGSLIDATAALTAAAAGDWPAAVVAADAALAGADAVLAALRAGEAASAPSTWRGLYFGDDLSDMQRGRDQAYALAAAVRAPAMPSQPLPPVDGSNKWYIWDDWQHAPLISARYPLSLTDDPAAAFATMVRTNCVFADVDAGICAPNADGGIWLGGRGGHVTLQVLQSATAPGPAAAGGDSEAAGWATIRYTLDGTTPTPASPAYVPGSPINLDTAAAGTATVHIRAVAFDANNTLLGAVRDTTWLRQ